MNGKVTRAMALIAIAGLAGGWPVAAQERVDDLNTLALYHLNQSSGTTAIDDNSSGRTAHPGTLTGSPLPAWSSGLYGNGLSYSFNQTSGLNAGNLMSLSANYTMEFWFYWDFTYNSEPGQLISSPAQDFIRGFIYDHGGSPSATPLGLEFLARTADGSFHSIATPEPLALFAGNWNHIAATRSWDGTTAEWKLYVNSGLVGSYSSTAGFWDSGADVFLGSSGSANSIAGDFDDFRFSNVVRTDFLPEPSSMGMVMFGLLLVTFRRRRI